MKDCIMLGFLFVMLIGIGLAENVEMGKVDAFQQALEKDGFTVQQGRISYFDLIKIYNAGVVPSAYGNNPTTKYLLYFVPPAPGHKVPELFAKIAASLGMSQNLSSFWNLGPDEAIVFVGRTPPECRYFSYDHYIVDRTYGNETRWIFANLADTVNNLVINTEGTPNGLAGNPFSQTTVIITTADKGIDHRIRAAVQSAGYSDNTTNTQMIPSSMLNMGLENNSDTFAIILRPALYKDQQAGNDYLNNTPAVILRVTPNESTKLDPYSYPELRVRGTGKTEFDLMDNLEELRMAILNKYSGLNATELPTSQIVPVGSDGIQRGIDALIPDNDACYLWTGNQTISSPTPPFPNLSQYYGFLRDPPITLGNDTNEFIIVYGVNHVATGKATYSNFGPFGADIWNGVGAITDADFNGTAKEYLPENPNAKYLYVYKVARNCDGDPHCFEVPYGPGGYGIHPNQPVFIFWRTYLEKATKTGPAYSEIVYDRAIKFSPYEISIIQEKPKLVVGIRKRGHYSEIAVVLPQLFEYALGHGAKIAGMPMFIMHEKSVGEAQKADQEGNADIEVCIPLAEKIPETNEIKCYEVPGGKMAKALHRGPYESSGATYEKLFAWIEKNDKKIFGPIREVYLNDPKEVRPEEILTEIFAPID